MTFKLTWLADTLRAAGLSVIEEPDWKERGRGEMGDVRGVLTHHTGAGSDKNLLALVRDGRADLAGPLSHLFLARTGTYHVLAAGRCNHAGPGSWQGVTAGNSQLIGIEAANRGDGTEPWPTEQLNAYVIGVAAILRKLGEDSVMAAGHKEYATPRGRKIDPAFDMVEFRERVEAVMNGAGFIPPVAPADPRRSMLRKGDRGNSVRELQALLDIRVDGDFGPKTDSAVRSFQRANGLTVDGLVGPATWRALGVKG
jgi:N-acetyl-anhydromuramyl-L-alanine amidase AmpD